MNGWNQGAAQEIDAKLQLTALHEAGHAVMATALGFIVEHVSVQPNPEKRSLGRICHVVGPTPTEEDCQAGAPWLEGMALVSLAGDRAARTFAPDLDTSQGGPSCDYAAAESLLGAVLEPADLEHELDRLCRKVDCWFGQDAWRVPLLQVTEALLDSRQLKGEELRRLISDGRCGAIHPDDASVRCTVRPHVTGKHQHVSSSRDGVRHLMWEGFAHRKNRRRGTARWRRVTNLTHPGWLVAPARAMTVAELNDYYAMVKDGSFYRLPKAEQTRLRTRAKNHMVKRVRSDRAPALAHPDPDLGTQARQETLRRHGNDCDLEPEIDVDGSIWCSACGLETVGMTAHAPRRSRYIYVVTAERLISWTEATGTTVQAPEWQVDEVFTNSTKAAAYVRLTRQRRPDALLMINRHVPT